MKSRMQESSHKSDEYDDDVIKRNAKALLKDYDAQREISSGKPVKKKKAVNESDAPTNSMGSSASDPDTGNVQGVSPLLGTCKPSKRKELEKQMKAMLKK